MDAFFLQEVSVQEMVIKNSFGVVNKQMVLAFFFSDHLPAVFVAPGSFKSIWITFSEADHLH